MVSMALSSDREKYYLFILKFICYLEIYLFILLKYYINIEYE